MYGEIAKGAPLAAASRREKKGGIRAVADVMSPAAVTTSERPSRYCTVASRFTTRSYVVSAFRWIVTVQPFEDLRAALSSVEGRLKPDTTYERLANAAF
jgi:hypothetical protein